MARWIHPAITRLQALTNPTARSVCQTATLPPLLRIMASQVLGTQPKFAAHEVLKLPRPTSGNPPRNDRRPEPEHRQTTEMLNQQTEMKNWALRSQMPVAPDHEVARLLRWCQDSLYCKDAVHPYRVPMTCIARATGVSLRTLFRILDSGQVGPRVGAKLLPVLRQVATGRLVFRRRGEGKWGGGKWEIYRPR